MVKSFRDPISGLTHCIGVLLAVVGSFLLLTRENGGETIYHTVSFLIFSVALILLYSISTLYHWLPLSEKNLVLFRKIDHIMIFVFIAVLNTPICLVSIRGVRGWSIFIGVWLFTLNSWNIFYFRVLFGTLASVPCKK